jgi:CRP/FNR family cyclic AMP-dependent transcriptional regulator
MAFMEWEFSEGPDNDGQFIATGKVIEQLRRHLARNEVDQAVALYESCVQETVGKELWDEFTTASVTTKKAIANLFYRSRDYQRAAIACQDLGEWGAAAKAFAASYDYKSAGKCLVQKGDPVGAAQMYEKAGEHRQAAELYYREKRIAESAIALEKAGDAFAAGQLFMQAKDDNRAAELLAKVPNSHPRYVHAAGILSEVLVRLGRRDLAAQRLGAALGGGAIKDPLRAELAYRLGRLMWEAGDGPQAKRAFEMVAVFNASFKDVQDCLRMISQGTLQVGQVTNPFAPVSGTQSMRIPPAQSTNTQTLPPARPIPKAVATDPFGSLDSVGALQALHRASTTPVAGPPQPAETVPVGYVQRMPGYEVMKQLPLFGDLGLDEMKALYNICEQVNFSRGDIIIEQGRPGGGLVLSRQGHMQVSKVLADGTETILARMPPGRYVGEMSLVEEVPTSARVTALDEVHALKIDKQRFEAFMFENDRIALRVYRTFVSTLSERLRQQNAAR